ncbi:hypothetical protein [Pseudovibrio sp. Alg231-02]|uniref:hypothetical protein n=1 Tax=Pseudovibrio sp. Alg231-02 TaxID=1922223 RepID=UPI000D54B264|nr:hypothetical protein [Pseudovibrio sp. Alg231-02]
MPSTPCCARECLRPYEGLQWAPKSYLTISYAFDASLSNLSGERIINLGCREDNNTRKLTRTGAHMADADLS